jgi:hypothetical protein
MRKVKIIHGAVKEFDIPATSDGLHHLSIANLQTGSMTMHVPFDTLDEEGRVNFVAMCQKALIHFRFILGVPVNRQPARTRVWRKFFRNRVDQEHGEGSTFLEFMSRFLRDANLNDILKCNEDGFEITGLFESSVMAAAALGRIVNMMHWCEAHTRSIKLISEASMTWDTFNKITLQGEQPIVRRRR